MKSDQIIRDPTFQLNLLLWMAKEQPLDSYRVRPLFFELNFRIIYIEQPFPFPPELSKLLEGSQLEVGFSEPELILGRSNDGKALYFEAKANSFSPASIKPARQARGHLVATGAVFSEVLAPLTSCLLCYVVPAARCSEMDNTLRELATELAAEDLKPGQFSCHGLRVDADKLIYSWDSSFKQYLKIEADDAVALNDLTEDTDPSPLVLVFSDEDCPNEEIRDFYRRAVIEQVRARLLCDLQALPEGQEYVVTADELLNETTDNVFQFLGRERQKNLRRLVRENLLKRVGVYWSSKQPEVRFEDGRLRILWPSVLERKDFLNWLEDRSFRFESTRPEERNMPLFDSLESSRTSE
jgi:hypothetical protein